jgi:hypothetical protein
MIFRLRSWTHYETKKPKGVPGLHSVGFKARPDQHAVMLHVGNIAVGETLSIERLREMVRETTELLESEAAQYSTDEEVGPPC